MRWKEIQRKPAKKAGKKGRKPFQRAKNKVQTAFGLNRPEL
jgi:hypothetical protein